ncbi:hypothetical protein Tco_0814328 [Tanacetum coccineum]
MEGWKPKDLKNKSFANIQEFFEKAMKRVNTFVEFRTELVEGTERKESSKRDEIIGQESKAKMKELMEVVPDEEGVAIDAIPLSTKPPSIVDYKIIKEGNINIYQIIRVDGSSKRRSSVEKRYPLTKATISEMLNKKLQADHWNEMYYQLLKLMTKQLKNQSSVWKHLLGD